MSEPLRTSLDDGTTELAVVKARVKPVAHGRLEVNLI